MSNEEYWKLLGKYHGYPDCCIKNFVYRDKVNNFTDPYQNAVHKNTGFIPCPSHAKKIFDGEATLEGLISNRVCKLPFPQSDTTTMRTYVKQHMLVKRLKQ